MPTRTDRQLAADAFHRAFLVNFVADLEQRELDFASDSEISDDDMDADSDSSSDSNSTSSSSSESSDSDDPDQKFKFRSERSARRSSDATSVYRSARVWPPVVGLVPGSLENPNACR
jgi:hypothetical protein